MKEKIAFYIFLVVILVIAMVYSLSYGKCYRIELRWDKNNKEEDLAGFRMYQGDVSGDPSHITLDNIPADSNTCIIDANMPVGSSTFFAATAFNDKGNESDYSNFVEFIAENQPPAANAQSVVTNKNTAVEIILAASDPDGDILTYSIFANPLHGTLSGGPKEIIYTPNRNYAGPDNFVFRANDGTVNSNDATVTIVVNDIPPTKPNNLKINRCLPIQ